MKSPDASARKPVDLPSHPFGFLARWLGVLSLFSWLAMAATANAQSTACNITAFSWNGYQGTIQEYEDYGGYGEIQVMVPFGTNLSSVAPTITVSPGATVSPASGATVDASGANLDPLLYTVTAQDGVTQREYDVYFYTTYAEAKMLSMSFGSTSATIGPLNNGISYVTIQLPSGTNLTNLAPTFTMSTGAESNIASGSTQDFTNAVGYTITSADGFESNTYVVMVSVPDPIFVNSGGSGVLTFGKLPSASSWSTLSVAGAAGDITTEGSMDTAVNAIAGSSINNPLSIYAGSAMGPAYWWLDQSKLGTQPTGNKMTLLKASLKNTSGGTLGGLAVSYQLGAVGTPAEQINGHRVYWSLTGTAGTWNTAGTYLRTTSGNTTVNFDIEFSAGWTNNQNLYVVWADDNGTGTQGVFTIDQVSFTPIAPAANILTFNVSGTAATISGNEISVVAPPGVNVANLAPTYTLSYGATCDIPSGSTRDFSNPVLYTVTSSNGLVTKVYTVNVVSSYWTQGVLAEFFDFNVDYGSLPDFTNLTPDIKRVDSVINYPSTNSAWTGLPGSMADTFGSRHSGAIRIDTAGAYTFYIESDDGSKMWLNDALIINNDGLHGMQERSATLNLATGYHPFRVEFFENGGGSGLIVRWAGPGIVKEVIPASAYYTLGTATTVTTTQLVSSLNPSLVGNSVTFTATLRHGASVATAATGTYAFRRNGSVLAVVPIANGVASYTTSSLASGSHVINATYSGDDTYRPSEATLTQVNNTPVTLTVNGGSGGGVYVPGQNVTIVAGLPAQGKAFNGWVVNSGSPTIADVSAASTTLTMPNTNVSVTATYRNVPPGRVTALAWYDAADAETIIELSGKVSEWRDKSGNNYHAKQTSASLRPTKEVGGLRFAGTDVHLGLPVMAGDAYTVMMVLKNDALFDSDIPASMLPRMPLSLQDFRAGPALGSSASAFNGEVVAMIDPNAMFYYLDVQAASSAKIASVSAAPHLYSFVLTDNWHIGVDGSPDLRNLTSGVRHPMMFSQKAGGIGASVQSKTNPDREWVGLISEILLVSSSITQSQREEIEGYFAWKWDAINGNNLLVSALPSGHPYKSFAPGTNTPPVAIAQSVTMDAGTSKSITLTGSDAEPNTTLSYAIVTQPSHGQLTGTPPNVTYTPAFGHTGSDSFSFKVNDGLVDSQSAAVSITVNQVDTFVQWAQASGYNLTGGRAGDDDGDGLTNFEEFAFGLNPTNGKSSNPIVAPLNKATHSFRYTRYKYSDLTYTVWTSSDLDYWGVNPVPVTEVVIATDADNVETVEVTLDAPPPQSERLFVRVMAN